jgi:hypothetical protein
LAFLLAGLIGFAEVTAIWVCQAAASVDLPETWTYAFVLSRVPYSVPLGAREDVLDQYFGGPPRPTGGVPVPRKCVRYQYSSGEVVTLLLDYGIVNEIWVSAEGSVPSACQRLMARTTLIDKPGTSESALWICERLPVRP